ncbi:MAG: alpha/beta fold hydrolase [Bacteroidetes bacterium]|nr:alpha/beta fold hydrolase [Bacteroidota bacterium]
MNSVLDYRIYGNAPEVVYILHGIFGMKDNWHQIANALAPDYTVVTADARNHGRSFHSHEMTYKIMAEDVAGLMEHLGHTQIHLVGHSMGGKTAMKFATLFPELLLSLTVVDIALRAYPPGHLPYFKAFEEIDFLSMQSRSEAEQALLPYAPDLQVRQFLLKNLEALPGGGYGPKFNLPAIKEFYLESIGKLNLPTPAYTRKTAIIYGENSSYVNEQDRLEFKEHFPQAFFIEIPAAGHWVHADNPTAFLTELKQFFIQ